MPALVSVDTAVNAGPGRYRTSLVSFNRPSDTTAYGANDVVSDSDLISVALQFPNVGRQGAILQASMWWEAAATENFELLLFDDEPTNHVDNAALACTTSDMDNIVGVIEFADSTKVTFGTGLEYRYGLLNAAAIANPIPYAADTGTLWGLLVVRTGHTPGSGVKCGVRISVDTGGA